MKENAVVDNNVYNAAGTTIGSCIKAGPFGVFRYT